MKYLTFFLFISILLLQNITAQENNKIDYFGQKPPGNSPIIFAPGIISTDQWEAAGTFSPDGKEYYFTRRPTEAGRENRLYHTKLIDGVWTKPELASFAEDVFEMEPHITQDGKTLFFNSERAKPDGVKYSGEIWYVEKKDGKWGNAEFLNSDVNDGFTMYVSSTEDETIYYTASYNKNYGIWFCKKIDGKYKNPEWISPEEIGIKYASHPFVDPKERFLIFDAQVSGRLKPELFISFRTKNGSWSKAINMGETINATKTEFGASLSPDGKYLFFHRKVNGNGDIFWVNSDVIWELKKQLR